MRSGRDLFLQRKCSGYAMGVAGQAVLHALSAAEAWPIRVTDLAVPNLDECEGVAMQIHSCAS